MLQISFFNNTPTTEIYTLSLHDALPISSQQRGREFEAAIKQQGQMAKMYNDEDRRQRLQTRSEEHTSELQSRRDLVCRLLLEKKKTLAQHFKHLLKCTTSP